MQQNISLSALNLIKSSLPLKLHAFHLSVSSRHKSIAQLTGFCQQQCIKLASIFTGVSHKRSLRAHLVSLNVNIIIRLAFYVSNLYFEQTNSTLLSHLNMTVFHNNKLRVEVFAPAQHEKWLTMHD